MSDLRGYLNEEVRKLIKEIKKFFFNLICKTVVLIKGIYLGNHCNFFGFTLFIRRYKSTIKIGNNVIFRSSLSSNQFGLYKNVSICTLKPDAIITIGNDCGLSGCSISAAKSISIGNNVLIGANVMISDYDWHGIVERANPKSAPLVIKDNVWIGANSIILKGVTIGKNTTIGAGSIVTKDIPPNCVAAGNPCRVIRYLSDES